MNQKPNKLLPLQLHTRKKKNIHSYRLVVSGRPGGGGTAWGEQEVLGEHVWGETRVGDRDEVA